MMTVRVQVDGVGEVISELREDVNSPGSYVVNLTERDEDGVVGREVWLIGEPDLKGGGFSKKRLARLAGSIAKHSVVRLR